jgi:RimJ/RimL family protein N-acetyltransferase
MSHPLTAWPPAAHRPVILRPWRVGDAAEALGIYGHPEVARWLSPEMDQVPDAAAMRLQHWIAEDARTAAPAGRWAIERRDDGRLLGGAILLRLPPGREDLEIGWQLHPQVWGFGYASETSRGVGELGVQPRRR